MLWVVQTQGRGLARRLLVSSSASATPTAVSLSSCAGAGTAAAPPPSLLAALPRLKRELARFDPEVPVESASTPPSSWFTDRAFQELEAASVFRDNPVAVGSTLQLPAPGDYFCGHVGHEHPFIVVRGEDKQVRAFYNVCRHKGMRAVMGDCGSLTEGKISCPYHGWEYKLDGRLAKATRIKGIKDFAAKEQGLVEIPISLWGGHLIFLHLDRAGQGTNDHQPPAGGGRGRGIAHLAPLLERLDAEHGFSQGLRHVKRRTYRLNCNWKVVIDNYDDGGLHVPHAHKGLNSNLDLGSYQSSLHDGYSIQSCGGSAENASDRVGKAALYAHIYPNLMVNRYGPWCDVNMVFPISPRKCEIVFDYYLEEKCIQEKIEHGRRDHSALETFIAESLAASDEVQQEDTFLCENVQIGLESAAYDTGRYAPGVEFPDHDFHVRLARELRAAVARLEEEQQEQ